MGLFGASGGGGLYAAGGNTATLNEGGGCGGMGLLHLEEVVVALIKLVETNGEWVNGQMKE